MFPSALALFSSALYFQRPTFELLSSALALFSIRPVFILDQPLNCKLYIPPPCIYSKPTSELFTSALVIVSSALFYVKLTFELFPPALDLISSALYLC